MGSDSLECIRKIKSGELMQHDTIAFWITIWATV
jgi:hypothetical protein